jgi:hypothetical protein
MTVRELLSTARFLFPCDVFTLWSPLTHDVASIGRAKRPPSRQARKVEPWWMRLLIERRR